MKRRSQLSIALILGEMLALAFFYNLIGFDNVSVLRYEFMYLMLGWILGCYECSTNLIWEEGKRVLNHDIAFFCAANVMNSLRMWTIDYMLANAMVAVLMFFFSMVYNRELRVLFRNYFAQRTIIIGVGDQARQLIDIYSNNRFALSKVVGIIDCNNSSSLPGVVQENKLGELEKIKIYKFDEMANVIKSQRINEAVIALSNVTKEQTSYIVDELYNQVEVIKSMPKVNTFMTFDSKVEDFDGVLLLSTYGSSSGHLSKLAKRFFDIFAGLFGCILLLPLTLVLKVAFMAEGDTDPLFFVQKRIGINGEMFNMYKFRSMVPDAEHVLEELMAKDEQIKKEYQENKKLLHDPRVTKVGQFIRKTSLDEFPQFLNVLFGTMSIVGPRPYLLREKDEMGKYYSDIIQCKPGITGMWQTHGRSDVSFEDRCRLDGYYNRNWSLWLDITILFRTFKTVFSHVGAR